MEEAGLANLKENFFEEKNSKISLSETFGIVRIDALKKSVFDVQELISKRQKLSSLIHEEGESLKSEIEKYLAENEKMQICSTDPTREKTGLRHKKIEISEMQLKEKVDCWKDIAVLKKELRELEQEIVEKEDRTKALNKILEGN